MVSAEITACHLHLAPFCSEGTVCCMRRRWRLRARCRTICFCLMAAVWADDEGRGWERALNLGRVFSRAGRAMRMAPPTSRRQCCALCCPACATRASPASGTTAHVFSGARTALLELQRGHACASQGSPYTYLPGCCNSLLSRRVGRAAPGLAILHIQHMPGPHAICLHVARRACATFALERSVDCFGVLSLTS